MTLNTPKWMRWLLVAPLLLMPAVTAMSSEISPETIKATYILQMRSFIKIGASKKSINSVCYYESKDVPFEESVGQQIEKYAHGHPAEGLSVKKFNAVRDFSSCDALYIPLEEQNNVDNILTALRTTQVLSISGSNKFILRGGMIGFIVDEDNHVKMEANMKNLQSKNIYVDAGLLEIMARVIN
jgi:hypothetical protein